jgi:hypothetical protein
MSRKKAKPLQLSNHRVARVKSVRQQPKVPARVRPAWLWLSSCLLRPKDVGAESIHPHLVALVAAGFKFPVGETRILPNLSSDAVVNLQVDTALEQAIHNT